MIKAVRIVHNIWITGIKSNQKHILTPIQKSMESISNLRVRIVVFGLDVVKKPLFIGASHVIIISQRIFATPWLKIFFATVTIVPFS